MKQLHPLLGSSVDSTKLALTWKGILLTLVPVVVTVLGLANITVSPETLVDFVNTLFAAITSSMAVYGAIRKGIVYLSNK
jgi:hypothetical protein